MDEDDRRGRREEKMNEEGEKTKRKKKGGSYRSGQLNGAKGERMEKYMFGRR